MVFLKQSKSVIFKELLLHKTLRSANTDGENLIPFTNCVQPKDGEDVNNEKEGLISRFIRWMDEMMDDILGFLMRRWEVLYSWIDSGYFLEHIRFFFGMQFL